MNKEQLKKMVENAEAPDMTDTIRSLKHSKIIRKDINTLIRLKDKFRKLRLSNPDSFQSICKQHCSFLRETYPYIFSKIINSSMDTTILYKFLDILKEIENGTYNQHEASCKVGEYLKEIFIDHKLKKNRPPKHNISWKEFKLQRLSQP